MFPQNDMVTPTRFNYLTRLRPWLSFMVAGLVLGLSILACGGSANGVVIVERLPTLTRTPLPTLTPTPNATQVAAALAAEVVIADNAQSLAPSEVAPAEAEAMVAEIDIAAEPIIPDTAPISPETLADRLAAEAVAPAENDPNTLAVAEDTPADSPPTEAVDLAENHPNVPTPAEDAPADNPPTSTAAATATELPPTPTETVIPTETPTLEPTPTATPQSQGWVFSDVQSYMEGYISGIVIYGNVLNDTGSPQPLNAINTILYDAQGQVIPYQEAFLTQVPPRTLDQGEQVPFEVAIPNVDDVADFDFEVP